MEITSVKVQAHQLAVYSILLLCVYALPLLCLCFFFFLSTCLFWLSGTACLSGAEADSVVVKPLVASEAEVEVWNRKILVLRVPYQEFSPEDRAKFAVERLNQIPANLPVYRVDAVDVVEGGNRGAWIRVNGRNILGIIEGDEDRAGGESFETYRQHAVTSVFSLLQTRKMQFHWPLLLRSVGFSLLATLLFALAGWGVLRLSLRGMIYLRRLGRDTKTQVVLGGVNITPYLVSFVSGLVTIFKALLLLSISYIWLIFVLSRFPYTEPFGLQLSGFLFLYFRAFGSALLAAVPGLFTVAVILYITRLLVTVITRFFYAVEDDSIKIR